MMSNKEIIEVVQAEEDGKEIEKTAIILSSSKWSRKSPDDRWNFDGCVYRVPRQPGPARQFDTEIIPDPLSLERDKLMKENESLKEKLKAKKKEWERMRQRDLDAHQIYCTVNNGWILYKVEATSTCIAYSFKRKVKK
jgi:hypothetical protein